MFENRLRNVLVLLTVFAAITAVGQMWGMEKIEKNEKLSGEIENIYFIVIEKNDPNDKVFTIYKMKTKDLPTAILPAIISKSYRHDFLAESSVMMSYPMSPECLEDINQLFKEKNLQPCEKICSFSKVNNGDMQILKTSETTGIDVEKAKNTISNYMTHNTQNTQPISKNTFIYTYFMNDEFYLKNIIEPLSEDINLPLFGVAKNGKIYLYSGNDANKRLNFKKEKFPNEKTKNITEKDTAYLIKGFINNNNEDLSSDCVCVGEVTTDRKGNEKFAWDKAFAKNTLDKKFNDKFFKALDKQHKRDVMEINVYLISKDTEENTATLYELDTAIPMPLKIALLKRATLINDLIIPFEGDDTKNSGNFCIANVISKAMCENMSKSLQFTFFDKFYSLKNDELEFSLDKKYRVHSLGNGKKTDNYDCTNEDGLKKLLENALNSEKNDDAYFQKNIIDPLKRQDKPLLALDDKGMLYLYIKPNISNNYFEKLKLIMQEKFTKTSGDKEEEMEMGFFLMKERINAQDGRFSPIGQIKENKFEWDKNFKKSQGFQKFENNVGGEAGLLKITKERVEKEQQNNVLIQELKIEDADRNLIKLAHNENNNNIEIENNNNKLQLVPYDSQSINNQMQEDKLKREQEDKLKKKQEELQRKQEKLKIEDKIEKNEKPKLDIKQFGIEHKIKKLVIEQFNRNIEQFGKEKLKREQLEKLKKKQEDKLKREQEENLSLVWSLVKGFFGGLALGKTQAYVNNNTSYFKKHENISDILFGGIGHGVLAYHCLSNIKAKPTIRSIDYSTMLRIPVLISTAAGYVCGRFHSKELKGYAKSIL